MPRTGNPYSDLPHRRHEQKPVQTIYSLILHLSSSTRQINILVPHTRYIPSVECSTSPDLQNAHGTRKITLVVGGKYSDAGGSISESMIASSGKRGFSVPVLGYIYNGRVAIPLKDRITMMTPIRNERYSDD